MGLNHQRYYLWCRRGVRSLALIDQYVLNVLNWIWMEYCGKLAGCCKANELVGIFIMFDGSKESDAILKLNAPGCLIIPVIYSQSIQLKIV